MSHLIGALVLGALSYLFWFILPKEAHEESSRGFVKIIKAVFGVKGYIALSKFLAVFMSISALTELYKFIVSIL